MMSRWLQFLKLTKAICWSLTSKTNLKVPLLRHTYGSKGSKLVQAQAERAVQGLFDKVFNLPVTKSDAGPLANLPYPKTPIPREKPVPQPKPPTKWEAFAKEKGIQKKQKRNRLVSFYFLGSEWL
jgi:regulator of ribosome biosynthesis